MKIRIKKKGLPKAQMWNSIVGQQPNIDQNGLVWGSNPNVVTQQDTNALNIQGPQVGFDYSGIPAINYNRSIYNTLMGNAPALLNTPGQQVQLKNSGAPNYAWTNFSTTPVPTNPNTNKGYKVQPLDPNLKNDATQNPIFGAAKNLQNTFNTGSADDIKKGIADFNDTYGTNLKDKRLFKLGAKGRDTFNKIGNIAGGVQAGIGVLSGATDFIVNKQNIQEMKNRGHLQGLSDSLINPVTRDDRGDYVQTGTDYGMLRPDQYVVNKGMYTAEEGGQIDNLMKIRITSAPQKMAYGGQNGYGLDLGQKKVYADMTDNPYDSASSSIGAVPREMANIEAEGGETVYGDLNGDGNLEHMKINGPRHTNGGVPLNVPEGSFIFSDTKKMKIKDPNILAFFGKKYKKGGFTPAELAKTYDINKYKAVLDDPDADFYAKNTADRMKENFEKKLSTLAMVQESMKGFPQGKPQVASLAEAAYGGYIPTMQTGGNNPSDVIFTPEFQNILAGLKKSNNVDMVYSPRIIAGDNSVPLMQHRQKTGQYGDITAAELDEFKKRHDWYFKDHPNWDFANDNDVKDFQTKYDDEFAKKYGYSYFTGKRKFDRKDGFLGEYTYNAPGLKSDPPAPGKPTTVPGFKCLGVDVNTGVPSFSKQSFNSEQERAASGFYESQAQASQYCNNPIEPNKFNPGNKPVTPAKYWKPDDWGLIGASLYPPKKYNPYIAPLDLEVPQPTFNDPNRELAANAEQMNIMTQGLNNYGTPQSYMANASGAQGKALENTANILSRYNNLIVGIANQFAPLQSQIRNQNKMYNAERATQLYDKNVIAAQQFDNARRLYAKGLIKAAQNRFGNRMYMDMLNKVNPYFNVDPRSGLTFYMPGLGVENLGKTSSASTGNIDWENFAKGYVQAKGKPGLENMTINEYRNLVLPRVSTTDTDNDGYPNNIRTNAFNNPYAQQLSQMAAAYSAFLNSANSAYPYATQQ